MFNQIRTTLRTKATESEKHFYNLTKHLGLNPVFQSRFHRNNGQNYYIDFRFKLTAKQLAVLRLSHWPIKPNKMLNHKLLIEIDGEYHNQQQAYDFQREQEILQRTKPNKYHFIRWTNHQVLYDSQFVLNQLYTICYQLWGIELQFKAVQDILYDNQEKQTKVYQF